jgi:hypothetical protein
VYPFPPPAVWTMDMFFMQGVPLSNTSNMNVQGVSQSIACSVDLQGLRILFHLVKCFLNAGMPVCPASGQSGTGMNKNADAGTSPVPE